MPNLVIIGGSIESLIFSILCSSKHEVTLIDIHPEIGFPSSTPGFIKDKEVLQKYLSEEEIEHLKILKNPDGYALRCEWLFKLLTINAVSKGVNVLLRCRIVDVLQNGGQTVVETVGGVNSGEGGIICDQLFDLRQFSAIAPGGLQHSFSVDDCNNSPVTKALLSQEISLSQQIEHWGGLVIAAECQNTAPNAVLQLLRGDGLCELWYDEKPTWSPKTGWIEVMENTNPDELVQMTIDKSIAFGESLFHSINH